MKAASAFRRAHKLSGSLFESVSLENPILKKLGKEKIYTHTITAVDAVRNAHMEDEFKARTEAEVLRERRVEQQAVFYLIENNDAQDIAKFGFYCGDSPIRLHASLQGALIASRGRPCNVIVGKALLGTKSCQAMHTAGHVTLSRSKRDFVIPKYLFLCVPAAKNTRRAGL